MANKHIKKLSNSSVIRGKHIRTTMGYCFVSVTQANIKCLGNTSCQWSCGHGETFRHCWREGRQGKPICTDDADSVDAHLVQGHISPTPDYMPQGNSHKEPNRDAKVDIDLSVVSWQVRGRPALITAGVLSSRWKQWTSYTQVDPKKQGSVKKVRNQMQSVTLFHFYKSKIHTHRNTLHE